LFFKQSFNIKKRRNSQSILKMNFDLEMWEINPSGLEQSPGFGVLPDRDISDFTLVRIFEITRILTSSEKPALVLVY